MSDYDFVARSSLKLKTSAGGMVVKKKSKKKSKSGDKTKPLKQQLIETAKQSDNDRQSDGRASSAGSSVDRWMTAAEKAFLEQQEKRQTSRIMAKASKSHKQRVEEFNNHLESLTEHYDIPKVSWTK